MVQVWQERLLRRLIAAIAHDRLVGARPSLLACQRHCRRLIGPIPQLITNISRHRLLLGRVVKARPQQSTPRYKVPSRHLTPACIASFFPLPCGKPQSFVAAVSCFPLGQNSPMHLAAFNGCTWSAPLFQSSVNEIETGWSGPSPLPVVEVQELAARITSTNAFACSNNGRFNRKNFL